MKKLSISILVFQLLLQCKAQQYNTWYFGYSAGLSFNSGGPTIPFALTDGINTAIEGNASVSDGNGNILFYTNGESIYNRTHAVMLNGNGLLGNVSALQSSVIIPAPGNDSIYYVVTTDANENSLANGYRYAVVNMKHDGGKGEVVTKNILLNVSCTERLTATRHANGTDVWIIGNENNSNVFKAWLVSNSGVQTVPVVSVVGNVLINKSFGTLKVSPDGTQLCQISYPNLTISDLPLQLFDFDNATGTFSNARTIPNLTGDYYGCEFSPDSKLLYMTRSAGNVIEQFEVKLGSAASINASRLSIPAVGGLFGIQTGPDGKIYIASDRQSLSVISQPNVKGVGCNFELDKISLINRKSGYGLPQPIYKGTINPCNNSNFNIQVPPGQIIDPGQSVQLYVTGGATSFQWSPTQWLSDPNIQNPVATPHDNITYTITATNDAGCKAVNSVAIQVKSIDGIYVPTGFTPGDDGRNDIFKPIMSARYNLEEFSVYNRWGQKVFSTHEYGKGWDGTLNNKKQNAGAYVWVVKVTDPLKKKIEKTGTVTLIR